MKQVPPGGLDRGPGNRFRDELRLLVPIFLEHRYRLVAGLLALLAVDGLQLLIPRELKVGVDLLTAGRGNSQALLSVAGTIVLIGLLVVLFRFCWRLLIIGFSRHLEHALRVRLFAHVVVMDQSFFSHWTGGDIMALASNDLAAVQMACGMGLVAALDGLVMSLAAIACMAGINSRLTGLAILPLPLLAVATRLLSSRLHRQFDRVQALFSRMTEFCRSSLGSIHLVKAYTLEKYQVRRFDQLGRQYVEANLQVARLQGLLVPLSGLTGHLGILAILVYGGSLVIDQVITLGDFVAFVSYLALLTWPMMALGWVANLWRRGMTSLMRINRLLTWKPALPEQPDVRPVRLRPPVSIRVAGLDFAYPDSDTPVLRHCSLHLKPGTTGLCGRTGSGKTTLCHLLLRLYPVPRGCLFVNDCDVTFLEPAGIRGLCAYVGQGPLLAADTIAANIRLGRPDASQEEVENAARLAVIHEEISGFQQGYASRIGERGVKLSGGQRQRIALARALLAARPVFIFDDGLTGVDPATEARIIANIRDFMEERTSLVISNRIQVLEHLSRIAVLEQGRITAQGDAASLEIHSSFFRHLRTGTDDGWLPAPAVSGRTEDTDHQAP